MDESISGTYFLSHRVKRSMKLDWMKKQVIINCIYLFALGVLNIQEGRSECENNLCEISLFPQVGCCA